ncbi:MAG: alpha-amylase family glycosyl hydrolase [Deltaproteobacteria bacterium]
MLRRLEALVLLTAFASGCAKQSYTHLYETQPIAPGFTASDVAALNHLGATLVDQGTNFSVYSEHATKVQLLLFDDPESPLPTQQFDLTPQGNVWNVFVSGVGLDQAYGYVAWGPNWPFDPTWQPGTIAGFQADVDSSGNRFDPNKLLLDPYARVIHRDFDWADGSAASGPDRTVSTFQAAGKAVTIQSQYPWSDHEAQWLLERQDPNMPGHRWQDQIVYEVHPKGLTASPASGVAHPGTFRGIGEDAAYLADLGVTAVELLPVMAKSTDGGYWGYDTIGFFFPELTYASVCNPTTGACQPDHPEGAIDEFKWMVDQLHQSGVEVYLDVVYNHTGEGGLWRQEIQQDDLPPLPDGAPQLLAFDPKEVASLLEFRGLDNQAYYGLAPDNQTYWDNSGVGQDTRANHTPFQRLILDSLHYWVSELHVDGFRFDEGAILGEPDQNYNAWDPTHSVLQQIADDPLLQKQNIRIVAEPWAAGGPGDRQGQFPASGTSPGYGWGEWNGSFRDWWRSFVNTDGWTLGSTVWTASPVPSGASGGFFLYGSQDLFQPNGRLPYHSYDFVTIHDGFTMYDLFSYNQPQNSCGPLNPGCCSQPADPSFCDQNSNNPNSNSNNNSRDWGQSNEDVKRQLMRDLFVAMLVSHGTPLLLGGDEWMRTQFGNNNAYSSLADNAYNWFDWGTWQAAPERNRMHDFVRQLIALRKQFSYALAPAGWGTGAPVSWEDAVAGKPANWGSRHLAMHYPPSALGPELDILINLETTATTFTLPAAPSWVRLVDTQTTFDEDAYFQGSGLSPNGSQNASLGSPVPVPGGSYVVQPRSIAILQGAAATTP